MMKRKLNDQDVPEPVHGRSFAGFDLDYRLLQSIVAERFEKPTSVQSRTIPSIQEGRSVAVCSRTGSGKTLAYLLPILDLILRNRDPPTSPTALILVPTKELASQISGVLKGLVRHCAKEVTYVNLSGKQDDGVLRSRLQEKPRIVVGTPGRFAQFLNNGSVSVNTIRYLVVDEADLVISYDYGEDLQSIAVALPASVQAIFMSATLRSETEVLTKLFCQSGSPEVIDLSEQEAADQSALDQYVVPTAEDEKFLLLYAIFKLQLIKGKIIIFVADVDRCYRLKLFLEQLGVRSCVLNSELPVNSRLHVVEEFNKGVYDTLIAADDNEVVGEGAASRKNQLRESAQTHEEQQQDEADDVHMEAVDQDESGDDSTKKATSKATTDTGKTPQDREYGVARGIDFRRVICVLNFDLPLSSRSYVHRIGRTARAGQKGMALSFYVPKDLYRKHKPTSIPQCANDEKVLERIKRRQEDKGAKLEQWQFDMEKLAGFRYRLVDALRAVTRIAVREARTRELRQELINSAKLQRHFEEHPEDLRHLRHDTESHSVRHQSHLKHVPEYLLPSGGQAALKRDVGFVGIKSNNQNRLRKARAFNKSKGKGRLARGKGFDPLKSLNAKGRGKK